MSSEWQTMSIASGGQSTLPKCSTKVFALKNTNDVSDIDGARSAVRYKVYEDKPQFLFTGDIEGAQSKVLARTRNTRDNTLYIDDIEGTRRTIKDRMMRTTRHVDPLCPNYPLPSYASMESIQMKFVKDPLEIHDIEGTHPKPKKTFSTRDIMSVGDIDGAKPGLKSSLRRNQSPPRDILNVSDISARQRYIDKTCRITDPNNPQYSVNGLEIKDDKYTKPRPPRNYVQGFSLDTKDIKGADAGSRYASPFQRREFRNTNYVGDIEGSKADTIRPGITTNRQTHPLQPVYQSLDPGELLLPVIAPLIPAEMVKVPTLPTVHGSSSFHGASSRPKSEPNFETNTWGDTMSAEFGGTNFNLPGMTLNMPNSLKPPRPASLSLTLPKSFVDTSGQNTNRATTRTSNVQNNANNIINFNATSARSTVKSVGTSPALTGRVTPTMVNKKAMIDYQADIDMVRQLV